MKQFILLSFLILFFMSCGSGTKKQIQSAPVIDPFVMNWFKDKVSKSEDTLPVLVSCRSGIQDISFLKMSSENYYTGHISRSQLEELMKDARIIKISSVKKIPMSPNK